MNTTMDRGMFPGEVVRDAHAVLFPAVGDTEVAPWLVSALQRGTRCVVLGETREEYVARTMSASRVHNETRDVVAAFVHQVRSHAQGDVLVAVDHEPWGTRRLQHVAPHLVRVGDDTTSEVLRSSAHEFATSAREMGVNAVLAPVLDRLDGNNPWLAGRTLERDGHEIGQLAAGFIAGAGHGGLLAAAKHFPGFPTVTADPAEELAVVPAGTWTVQCLEPFRDCVAAGVPAVMMGPAPVLDLDPTQPASTSARLVGLLRDELGFQGLVISDDLDAPATRCGRTLPETARDAIRAGVELLLLAGGEDLAGVAQGLVDEATTNDDFRDRLHRSAEHVRAVVQSTAR